MAISFKTAQEIAAMKKGGKILAEILENLKTKVVPGVTTKELDTYAEELMKKAGVLPSFKGYHGYPAVLCASVNEEVVHAIPGNRILNEGDIIGLDCGVVVEGMHTDHAITIGVGKISVENAQLIRVTERALSIAINMIKPGVTIGDIGSVIQKYVEGQGFSIVRELTGHGVGHKLHEDPFIPNFGKPGHGVAIKPGMTIAIEPIVTAGNRFTKTLSDHWTIVTQDKSWSAHFEHSLVITPNGCEILTKA